jgi:large conductance mechanosensitive channel
MFKDFKEFISRGNVIDLAVAVILGAAFTAVVTSFANGILMNVIAAVFGQPNFDSLTFSLGQGEIRYGLFLTALVNFVIVAVAMFLVVKAISTMQSVHRREEEEAEAEATEIELLTQIRDALVARRD